MIQLKVETSACRTSTISPVKYRSLSLISMGVARQGWEWQIRQGKVARWNNYKFWGTEITI